MASDDMNPALVDTLDWVEEMRDDLREGMIRQSDGHRHSFDPAKCGTSANYRQHLRLGIPPCRSCRQVESIRTSKYRQDNGEKVRENRRRWYEDNKDEINRKRRDWRACRT